MYNKIKLIARNSNKYIKFILQNIAKISKNIVKFEIKLKIKCKYNNLLN